LSVQDDRNYPLRPNRRDTTSNRDGRGSASIGLVGGLWIWDRTEPLRRAPITQDVLFVMCEAVGHLPWARLRHRFYSICMGVKLAPGARINGGAEIRKGHIAIGQNTIVGHNVILDGRMRITIGAHVNLSSEAAIWTLQHQVDDPEFGSDGGEVRVGDRAWISFRATVLPGVTIGEGAVVAAHALVTDDVAPYSIVAGIPARKIGERPRGLTYTLGSSHHFI
jgi:acetyltransferase-like isoleucine patch superfamily enzyme